MKKEGKGKFGQVRTIKDKATNQKNWGKGRKNKKRKQQMGKGNKNLSDDGEEGEEEGGGESRVQNSLKAFGELKIPSIQIMGTRYLKFFFILSEFYGKTANSIVHSWTF